MALKEVRTCDVCGEKYVGERRMLEQIIRCDLCQTEIKYSPIRTENVRIFPGDKIACSDCFSRLRGWLCMLGLHDLSDALAARPEFKSVASVLGVEEKCP